MRTLFILPIAFTTIIASAQEVAKTIIVEHFTNTYCSACASRNPGFYANLDNHPEVLHVAYHPSSPYSSCTLNQHNVSENDARPMYYGVFGGTPRIIVQGEVVAPGADYSSSTIFDAYENQTTPFDMSTSVSQNITLDSVIVSVTIAKTASSSIDSLNIHTVLVEETLNFNANNGENVHYDVFRKSMNGEDPVKIKLPVNVGTDTTITYTVKIDSEWNGNQMKSVTLLQNDQRQIEQANESMKLNYTAGLEDFKIESITAYPNPANDFIRISAGKMMDQVQLLSSDGKLIFEVYPKTNDYILDVKDLSKGSYFIKVLNSEGSTSKQVLKQ